MLRVAYVRWLRAEGCRWVAGPEGWVYLRMRRHIWCHACARCLMTAAAVTGMTRHEVRRVGVQVALDLGQRHGRVRRAVLVIAQQQRRAQTAVRRLVVAASTAAHRSRRRRPWRHALLGAAHVLLLVETGRFAELRHAGRLCWRRHHASLRKRLPELLQVVCIIQQRGVVALWRLRRRIHRHGSWVHQSVVAVASERLVAQHVGVKDVRRSGALMTGRLVARRLVGIHLGHDRRQRAGRGVAVVARHAVGVHHACARHTGEVHARLLFLLATDDALGHLREQVVVERREAASCRVGR